MIEGGLITIISLFAVGIPFSIWRFYTTKYLTIRKNIIQEKKIEKILDKPEEKIPEEKIIIEENKEIEENEGNKEVIDISKENITETNSEILIEEIKSEEIEKQIDEQIEKEIEKQKEEEQQYKEIIHQEPLKEEIKEKLLEEIKEEIKEEPKKQNKIEKIKNKIKTKYDKYKNYLRKNKK